MANSTFLRKILLLAVLVVTSNALPIFAAKDNSQASKTLRETIKKTYIQNYFILNNKNKWQFKPGVDQKTKNDLLKLITFIDEQATHSELEYINTCPYSPADKIKYITSIINTRRRKQAIKSHYLKDAGTLNEKTDEFTFNDTTNEALKKTLSEFINFIDSEATNNDLEIIFNSKPQLDNVLLYMKQTIIENICLRPYLRYNSEKKEYEIKDSISDEKKNQLFYFSEYIKKEKNNDFIENLYDAIKDSKILLKRIEQYENRPFSEKTNDLINSSMNFQLSAESLKRLYNKFSNNEINKLAFAIDLVVLGLISKFYQPEKQNTNIHATCIQKIKNQIKSICSDPYVVSTLTLLLVNKACGQSVDFDTCLYTIFPITTLRSYTAQLQNLNSTLIPKSDEMRKKLNPLFIEVGRNYESIQNKKPSRNNYFKEQVCKIADAQTHTLNQPQDKTHYNSIVQTAAGMYMAQSSVSFFVNIFKTNPTYGMWLCSSLGIQWLGQLIVSKGYDANKTNSTILQAMQGILLNPVVGPALIIMITDYMMGSTEFSTAAIGGLFAQSISTVFTINRVKNATINYVWTPAKYISSGAWNYFTKKATQKLKPA